MIKFLILLYLIIGALFDMKVFKSTGSTTSDPAILAMIHIIMVFMWPAVILMILHTAATKVETKESKLEPKAEGKKTEEKK